MMPSSGDLYQFYNCKILRNSKIYEDDLWVRNAKIVNPEKIFYDEKIVADKKIDCCGALISPGFIDVQINGGFGYDFSTLNKNDAEISVSKVAKGILQHGVTSFCPTVITSSPDKYKEIIPSIKKMPGGNHGAGVLGVHVEGPFINKDKKGAHPIQHIKTFNNGFEDVLSVYGTLDSICILTMAPELDINGHVIKELVRHGITVSLDIINPVNFVAIRAGQVGRLVDLTWNVTDAGHSNGSLLDGERGFAHGASFITHLFNAMLPFHHRDPGLVGLLTSKKLPQNKTVFYGIIADGIHTHPAALRIAFYSNPSGLILVTDAMSAMGLKSGIYCIGEQIVEVSDNRAVVAGTNTLSGSIATMDYCIRFLLKSTGCSLVEALECATLHPAQLLGITDSKGTLDFGTDADFVLLSEDLFVQSTYINGQCVWSKIVETMNDEN